MLELQTKIKRQIEIVGLVSGADSDCHIADLADLFNCEELTIKRDLQELRMAGIDIHSVKQQGVCIGSPIEPGVITELVLQYVGICYSLNAMDKTTSLMVRKKKLRALHDIVHLQRCIEHRRLAAIDYEKEKGTVERGREIGPLLIFQSDGLYRLLALHDGKVKQYHLNKIVALRPTKKSFKPIPADHVEDLFRYSWRSWIGDERHAVMLRLSKAWMEWKNPLVLMETESITEQPDGSAVITLTVNSLSEIATWIAGRGAGITVLEPAALREKVIELATGVIENYT